MPSRQFSAPASISGAAQRFINGSEPLVAFDIQHAALLAKRREIHALVAPGGVAVQENLGVSVTRGSIGGVEVQWISPQTPRNANTIVYFFGGGHITGSPDEDLVITARIAHFTGSRVCAPWYRLAPENPYPAALDDAVAVYTGLMAGQDASGLALAGESAGANLVLALMGVLAARGHAMPAVLALLSPWCDLTHSGDTIRTLNGIDPTLDLDHHLQHMARAYAAGRALESPGISPLFADVPHGFPPTIITTGTRDVLLSDCARLSTKLRAAGVTVDLQVTEGMWHVFEYYPDIPEGEASVRQIAGFLNRFLSP